MRSAFRIIKIFLFVSVLAVNGFSAQAVAAADTGWATVDTRLLLMLHPSMNNFDYASGRFFRDAAKKSFDKVVKELKSAREKADKETSSIREQQRLLQQTRFDLFRQQMKATQRLTPADIERLQRDKADLETSRKELARKKPSDRDAEKLFSAKMADIKNKLAIVESSIEGQLANKNTGDLEKQIQQKIGEVDEKLLALAAKILEVEERAVSSIYLTTDETQARLKKIKDEISSLIEKAAKESKIAVVMDASFAMRSQKSSERTTMIPTSEEAPDVISSALFHSFTNLEISPELQASLTGPGGSPLPPEHLVVGRSIGLKDNLTEYLEFRNYMPEKVAGFSTGRLFITGSIDLTPWVARQLFERYKVPETLKNSFMLLIRNYLDFEKDPVVRERDY